MMSKAPRWPEVLVNTKIHKPTQKKAGKEASSLTVPVSSRSKQAGSSASKATLNGRRSNSVSSSDGDSKAVATLKRSSHKGRGGHWASRPSSHPTRPALQLCSSRSFSSLHTSSLTNAPFMRNSRSLNRLDQRTTGDESDVDAKAQFRKKKVLVSGKLSSEETVRNNKERYCGDNDEKKEISSSSETLESSSSDLSSRACLQPGGKVKKENKEGGYSPVTTGTGRNFMQTVLKNMRPTPVAVSNQLELNARDVSEVEHQDNRLQENTCCDGAEDSEKPKEVIELQQTMEETADKSSLSSPSLSPTSSPCTDYPSPISQTRQLEDGKEGSTYSPSCVMPSYEQEHRPCEAEREQLVKELEQTQKELSLLQQLSSNLQNELQQERESHLREKNELLFNSNSSSEPASTLQRLQKMNHELRVELEAQKTIQEEAREAELRQRVDLLAQQAQLLVTGDATALAQAHLEQERRCFHGQRVEWERSVSSLKTQLSFSEEKRKESELRITHLQEELYSHQAVRKEAEELKKNLQEATTQLRTNEDAQAQKESLLQKHLMLLRASQDRERKSLTASLARAEQHSQELQERLERTEQQIESQDKTHMRSTDIEDTQQQLQKELASSVAAVQKYRDEKEQIERQCQELQYHLSEAHEEVSMLQSSLTTQETHYQDLKHSYESISEKLLEALEKAQQREAETQEMRDSFERHLDTKEQELNEVLLKMEVLGNSLEETEAHLNEMLKVCTCASSHEEDESLEAVLHTEVIVEPQFPSDSRSEERDVFSSSPNDLNTHHRARVRSHSLGPSHQYVITSGDDPERFTTVIQLLETKLFVTEEKLREITERLEEHQDHKTCQDPHLDSQLTQSRGSAQHLALPLHSRTRQSQRFAQETENICRLLAARFQLALNIIQSCREKLQTSTTIELTDFERKLSAVETCLQQGQHDAEKQQHASFNAYEVEDKIPSDVLAEAESSINANGELTNTVHSEDIISVGQCLMRELVLVEKMLAALKSSNEQLKFLVPRKDGMSVAQRYKLIISQILTLNKTNLEGREESKDHKIIIRACIEAEFIYTAFKIQQQYQNESQGYKSEGPADTSPPDFSSYEGQENKEDVVLELTAALQSEDMPPWFERLITRLQRRAKVLGQLSQEVTCTVDNCETAPGVDLNWMQEQAKLLYLTDRLYLDLEQEQQRCVVLQDKLQALCKQQVASLTDEREAFNHTLCELQKDNRALKEELEHAEDKIISMETGNQRLQENKQRIEDYHRERMQKLEAEYQMKIKEQRQIHEEEMKHLHEHHMRYFVSKEKHTADCKDTPSLHKGSSSPTEQQEACLDFENHQVFCGEHFTGMEEMHRKLIAELQQQHEKQVEELLQEKEQLIQEETTTAIAYIAAMRRVHKVDPESGRQPQHAYESDDITQMHNEYQKAMVLLNKELEMLSLQHTQKCLENSQLRGELQFERNFFRKQRESPEIKPKQSSLQARETEIHLLRQELFSVREELKIARTNKMKDFYENNHADSNQDVKAISEDVRFANLSSSRAGQKPDVNAANKNNAAFVKKTDKPSLLRRLRAARSKSLKEGLSGQERMKLFDSF
ncbi:myosin-8-like isoform X1 [Phycodurus eques]|uniref:myosin-8-like isoform X1 n=2 Tax=Phycodurus eques TaxID=693459 RepID=UPI002ACE9980|nr:myosin-8-like isoform X1 [Phycodurus eques]